MTPAVAASAPAARPIERFAATVLSLNLVGDGLNEILNPRSDP